MNPVIIKKPGAKRDLVDHFDFIGQDNPAVAERFLEAAEEGFLTLAEMPGLGRAWRSPRPGLKDVRVWAIRGFNNYLIFYRPIEGGVEVLHVFHGARHIELILEEEDA